MKAIWMFLASAAALCVAAEEQVESKYLHTPLLLWSDRAVLSGQNAYSGAKLDEAGVADALKSVLSDDTTSSLLSSQAVSDKSELLVLFLSTKLGGADLSKFSTDGTSFVESAVKSATSSVTVPRTTRGSTLQEAIKDASISAPEVTDVATWIASDEGKTLLSDGKTNLVIVKIPDDSTLPEADALIENTVSLFSKTGKTVDFGLTGNEADVTQVTRSRRLASSTTISCPTGYYVGEDSEGNEFCFGHYVRITPNVLGGIVIGVFFVFLGYVGLSAMHGIQTPTKYPHQGPPKGKEF